MAKPKRNRVSQNHKSSSSPEVKTAPLESEKSTVKISVRLDHDLAKYARSCSGSSGVSLNALISIALADYLASKGYNVYS